MAITFKDVRKIALSLENVQEGTSYGTAAFKAGGQLLARLREDGDSLVVGTTFEERGEMMAAEPKTYYITDHYRNYPWVLVRLSQANSDAVRDLLKGALRLASTKRRPASTRRPGQRPRRSPRE
ncbi:MAG: MmcQ/YjbR family DNA-binding protein [Candidatus Acidiferrum sp.]